MQPSPLRGESVKMRVLESIVLNMPTFTQTASFILKCTKGILLTLLGKSACTVCLQDMWDVLPLFVSCGNFSFKVSPPHTHWPHIFFSPFPSTLLLLLLLLTCFIVVCRELVQHVTIHSQDALLENAGVRESALSFLSLKGLQLLLQGLGQVGLHIVSCSLRRQKGKKGGTERIRHRTVPVIITNK